MKLIIIVGFFLVATRLVFSEDETCLCTQELNPICGTNNQTYGNPCKLDCYNKNNPGSCKISRARNGTCRAGCVCTLIYAPVCGSDNKTYGSDCSFYCTAVADDKPYLTVTYNGECGTNTTTTTTTPGNVEADPSEE